jgi:hypothetical protein
VRCVIVFAAAAATVLGLVPAPPVGAVTGGAADGSGHPYVGMLSRAGGAGPWCTVVLVRNAAGAAVGLTDAHCLYRQGRRNGTGVAVTFTPTWTATGVRYNANWYIDPAYDPARHLHDVAALVFGSAPPVAPATLAPPAAAPRAATGATVDTVGTGQPYPGQRRAATERVTGYNSSWLYLKPGSGNTCGGDSGGPDLLAGTSTVVALTNQGTCSYDEDTRVDTAAAHAFVDTATTLPHTTPQLTQRLSSSWTHAGGSVTLTGSTSALYSGERVVRQGYYSGGWHTWAVGIVSATGRFAFTIHPTVATIDYYRVLLPRSATHPAGHTSTIALHVSP